MKVKILFILNSIVVNVFCTNSFASDDLRILDQLKMLNLSELSKVGIHLDHNFDVFNGLIREKRTSIATGTQQFTGYTPAVTSVITSQDIEVMGARTLEDVLQSIPGLQVSHNWFNIPIYSVRGIASSYNPEILVLINGQRINDHFSGSKSLFWSTFPVSTIQRIEVIRGPGSALYGADAFSGVMNIITKTSKDINGTEIGARIGSNQTRDGWILHGSHRNGFDIAAMLDFSQTDGHQRIVEADAQTVFDQVFATDASLTPSEYGSELTTYNIQFDLAKQHWRWRANFFKSDEMGAGVGNAQALDPTKPINLERFTTNLIYHNPNVTDNVEIEARLDYWHTYFLAMWQLYPPNAFGGVYPIGFLGYPSASESQSQFSFTTSYRGLQDHQIRVGLGYAYYDLYKIGELRNFGLNPFTGEVLSPLDLFDGTDTIAAYMPEVARDDKFIFIQDTWTLNEKWKLTAGIRYDRYSDFGSTTNPRLGLVWQPHFDLAVKLLYGQAFRAPSFQELHNQNNPVSQGNPNLKPEQIKTWELAFDYYARDNIHLSLNLFHYDIEDRIKITPLTDSISGYDNIASAQGQGFEFETRWKVNNQSSLLFNYSYQHSEDDKGYRLSDASKQVGFLRADYLLDSQWYIDAQLNWNDGWTRAVNDPRPNLDGYATMDLVLRHKAIQAGNFAVGVKNVFNADVRYPSPSPDIGSRVVNIPNDILGADRSYFMEFRYKF